MSNAAIYCSWGHAIPGRETKALEVFSQAMELNATLEILRSTGGLFEPMKTIQAVKETAHNETAARTGLRAVSIVIRPHCRFHCY